MKILTLSLILACLGNTLVAQNVYTIKADSVKITNCDSAELIIENHTQNIPGFLYNTGNGRTIFKRPVTKINDTLYLIGSDTLHMRFPQAWVQGGNAFGTTGKIGTLDNQYMDFYTNNTRAARLSPAGNLLLGPTTDSTFKLHVFGAARFVVPSFVDVSAGDPYDIRIVPEYVNTSVIQFDGPGGIDGAIGVNKVAMGAIPAGSLTMGGTSPTRIAAITDFNSCPIFVADGLGIATINGGYHGILFGDSGVTANSNSFDFKINGGIGTGTGTTGDIIFSTGNSQASGTSIHTLTNRWWLKGSTGYLSNTSTPTSSLDITGANGYSQLRLRTTYTPSSTTDTNGNVGDFSWDDNYFYIKTSAGWKRSALSTF